MPKRLLTLDEHENIISALARFATFVLYSLMVIHLSCL